MFLPYLYDILKITNNNSLVPESLALFKVSWNHCGHHHRPYYGSILLAGLDSRNMALGSAWHIIRGNTLVRLQMLRPQKT